MKTDHAQEIRRNITLSLPKSLISRAKVAAVKLDKSLSEFMREALEEKLEQGSEYRKAKQRQLELLGKGFDLGTGGRISITRDELHERR